jgi:hypothetical protein
MKEEQIVNTNLDVINNDIALIIAHCCKLEMRHFQILKKLLKLSKKRVKIKVARGFMSVPTKYGHYINNGPNMQCPKLSRILSYNCLK